jgi:hypothetical protein
MYILRYNCLLNAVQFIIDNENKNIEYINENVKQFFEETITGEPIIPCPIILNCIEINQMLFFLLKKADGKRIRTKKVEIKENDEDKIFSIIEHFINEYAQTLLNKPEYNFARDKNIVDIVVNWKQFKENFSTYKGIQLLEWRKHLKKISKNTEIFDFHKNKIKIS